MDVRLEGLEALAEGAHEVSSCRTFTCTPGHSKSRERALINDAFAAGDTELLKALIDNGMDTAMHIVAAAVHGLRSSGITDLSEKNIDSRSTPASWISEALSGRSNFSHLSHDKPTSDNLIHYAAAHPEKASMLLRAIRTGLHDSSKDIIETVEIKFSISPVFHTGVL